MSDMDEYALMVEVYADRPDFRVFADYIFEAPFHQYHSQGNSDPYWSRQWTELYIGSDEVPDFWFEITCVDLEPVMRLYVYSPIPEVVNRIAYFLARETKGVVFGETGETIPLELLAGQMGDFDLEARLAAADQSIWRNSSAENPYPSRP